ncbi:hypothetical protein WJX72_010631 [[Myrmecia] bisecta]|uniref:Folylpolyglutamate synthase n=1 Tax=[Myrmecia] bisecta TaxID=41462 RepID=A0AAW1Q877_9CHLO
MNTYLQRLDLSERLKTLRVVHVAGTKGKGSTCAMVESMLRASGYRTGLFTSPHLWDVRERIRLNGQPIERAQFSEHFWKCFNALREQADAHVGMPAYFRFLTLLGLRVFVEEQVDVAILEVGLGGRLDATNCIPPPIVCGVTPLGLDHTELLGNTLEEIAKEKAGIFKAGSVAYTADQQPQALAVLQAQARQAGLPLSSASPLEAWAGGTGVQVGLAGEHQRANAGLAVALAASWELQVAASDPERFPQAVRHAPLLTRHQLPGEYIEGLTSCYWPGRGQVVEDVSEVPGQSPSRLTFFLDGAHTPESMVTCGEWFAATAGPAGRALHNGTGTAGPALLQRVLLFHCMQERSPQLLFSRLVTTLKDNGTGMHHAVFVPPDSSRQQLANGCSMPDMPWHQHMQTVWQAAVGGTADKAAIGLPRMPACGSIMQDSRRGAITPSLQATLDWLRRCVKEGPPRLHMQVLVTGSLYLVGDMLQRLGRAPAN